MTKKYTARLRLLWHPQPQFAGALVAQHSGIASEFGLKLECQPLDFAEGPIEAVLSGNADLCVASPSHLLESENPEALSLLLTFQQKSPLLYPAWRDHGITDLSDLSGRRIAVWPSEEDLEIRWMLHRAGVDLATVERVPTTDTVGMLLSGEVSCAQMTGYHEYHEFLERGANPDRTISFRADASGLGLLKDGVIARRDWLDEDPGRAQAVVNSLLAGWTRALRDGEHALSVCQQVCPDMNVAQLTHQYDDIRKLILTGATHTQGLGYPTIDHMKRSLQALADVEGRKIGSTAESFIAEQYWQNAPTALRSADWE